MIDLNYHFSYREKNHGWQVILSYKDQAGQWKQKSRQGLATKKAAKTAGEKLLSDVLDAMKSQPIAPELVDITLAEFAEYVFRNRNLAYNSILAYRYALKNYGPTLLDMPVRKITYLDIQRAMSGWQCSNASYQLYVACLKMILSQAVEPYHIRQDNPAKCVKPPRAKEKRKVRALTQEEFAMILKNTEHHPAKYYVACALAGYAGLRFGEICGLTWDDIDFVGKQLHVTKQYGRIGNGKKGVRQLKNGASGCRSLPMPPRLIQILRQYKQQQPLSFNRSLWDTMPYSSTIATYIQQVVPDATIHSLRHTYATMLLANGTDIKTVSALLGDTITTVLNVYVDYTDDMRRDAARKVAEIFA